MIKPIISIFIMLFVVQQASSQKMMKPSIMVVPSDTWCNSHGFLEEKSGSDFFPDYRRALVEDPDLINVISKINSIMADRGFPLQNLETALKKLKTEDVERKFYTDKNGYSLQSTPLDELYRVASSDIVLQLSWKINKEGPKKSVTFNLQALDSYTTNQVAGAEGTGKSSFSTDVSILLEEAVMSHLDTFCDCLMAHFKNAREAGREISIDFLLSKDASIDFATEFDDYELSEIITKAVARGAVGCSFSKGPSTDSMLQYINVRMPIADEDGMPQDAYAFVRKITRELRKAPYNLSVKVIPKGLGKAIAVIGEN